MSVADTEAYALSEYKGSSSSINNALRLDAASASKFTTVKDLDALLAKAVLKDNIVAFRGIQDASAVLQGKTLEQMLGAEFTDPGYSSTTLNRAQMEKYVGPKGKGRPHGAAGARGHPCLLHGKHASQAR